MTKRNRNDGVGYKKPPRSGQFKPGQSGNAKGRPKGSKNLATVIQKELDSTISVTENGKRRRITKRQAAAKQYVNKAITGDTKFVPLLLKVDGADATDSSGQLDSEVFSGESDQLVMADIIRRIRQPDTPSPTGDDPGNEPAPCPEPVTPPSGDPS